MLDHEPYLPGEQVYYNDSKWKLSVKTTIVKYTTGKEGNYRYLTELFSLTYFGGQTVQGKLSREPLFPVADDPDFLYIEEEKKQSGKNL